MFLIRIHIVLCYVRLLFLIHVYILFIVLLIWKCIPTIKNHYHPKWVWLKLFFFLLYRMHGIIHTNIVYAQRMRECKAITKTPFCYEVFFPKSKEDKQTKKKRLPIDPRSNPQCKIKKSIA